MSDHTYVARSGWTPRDLILVPTCAGFVFLGILMVRDGQLAGALVCLFGGAYIVLSVWAMVSRRIALAVTEDGITLGQLPPWPARRTSFVPWSDIEAVILWEQELRRSTMRYIGVVRRPGAPPLPGSARSPRLRRMNKAVVPAELSEDLVADSRQINFWRLDKGRLITAVNHFRPDVPVMEHS